MCDLGAEVGSGPESSKSSSILLIVSHLASTESLSFLSSSFSSCCRSLFVCNLFLDLCRVCKGLVGIVLARRAMYSGYDDEPELGKSNDSM